MLFIVIGGLVLLVGFIFIIGIFVVVMYNRFISLAERVKNARGQIAAQIESRWDAVSNLISATKEYAQFESETLEKIVEKRTNIGDGSSIDDIEANDSQLNNIVGRLLAISESYPDLKASEVYKETMQSVNKFEDNVRHARMIYNDVVTRYNRQLKQFPSNFVGKMFKFTEEKYFERSEEKAEMPSWSEGRSG